MNREHGSLRHRPFLTPIWLSAIGACVALGLAVFALWVWGTANSTTVVVIRHAEKEAGSLVDPPLSAAGETRAALLASMFGGQGTGRIDAIYVSPTIRARATAAPLAARLGELPVVAPADDAQDLAKRVLREHSGGRVLIIGHLNTVPKIVAALSGRNDIPEINEHDYGTLYVVTVPRIGHANVLRLSY